MATVRPDDDLYRIRLKYLGPAGYTFPAHLTYAQWGVFAAIMSVLTILGLLIFQTLSVLGATLALSIVTTWFIFKHVDADQPARKIVRAFLADRRALRNPEARTDRLSGAHIRVRHEYTDEEVIR